MKIPLGRHKVSRFLFFPDFSPGLLFAVDGGRIDFQIAGCFCNIAVAGFDCVFYDFFFEFTERAYLFRCNEIQSGRFPILLRVPDIGWELFMIFEVEHGRRQNRTVMHDNGVPDDVFQFPHITGPEVAAQKIFCFGAQGPEILFFFFCRPGQEGFGKQEDVVATGSQRRHIYRDNVQTVIEIFAKQAFSDGVQGIPVGGTDETDIDLFRGAASDGGEGPGLDEAQQF